ncbi:hypothetical protein KFL_002890070 [Klebsormidium nitens]|uniref:Uncharacterized protein n=1 Tax=Klebsormidium nitens TaxID=105231 RepID=A0A1Y1I662_KLENI|nr:hypothetical protein KFL_002890070 [Klebsormidium nitens]|eukprot:GAQ86440.1 hypothetical protein KFL_002890070 [Klebsormidium nitens]
MEERESAWKRELERRERACEDAERKLREERLALDKQKRVFEGKAEEGDGVLEITLGKENYRCLRFAKKRSDY